MFPVAFERASWWAHGDWGGLLSLPADCSPPCLPNPHKAPCSPSVGCKTGSAWLQLVWTRACTGSQLVALLAVRAWAAPRCRRATMSNRIRCSSVCQGLKTHMWRSTYRAGKGTCSHLAGRNQAIAWGIHRACLKRPRTPPALLLRHLPQQRKALERALAYVGNHAERQRQGLRVSADSDPGGLHALQQRRRPRFN